MFENNHPPHPLSYGGRQACHGLEPSTPRHLKKFYIFVKKRKVMKMNNPFEGSDYVGGLYVKDGRLINNRPDGETTIKIYTSTKIFSVCLFVNWDSLGYPFFYVVNRHY